MAAWAAEVPSPLEPTPEAWDLIGDIGVAWGADWARTIRDEIAAGTFVALDGRPCACKAVGSLSHRADRDSHEQLRLGGEAA